MRHQKARIIADIGVWVSAGLAFGWLLFGIGRFVVRLLSTMVLSSAPVGGKALLIQIMTTTSFLCVGFALNPQNLPPRLH